MIVCLLTALALRQPALKLSPLFSDNMVLQRDIAAPVFGVAEPHQAVTVTVGELTATTKADDAGKWIVRLQRHGRGSMALLRSIEHGAAGIVC
jgi:sialate O-acetylesterase